MSRHKKHRPSLNSLYQWHRYLGLAVALLAALLAITGIMLNHTEQLALDQKQIQQRWLLNWYGISPVEGRFYRVGDHWLSQWGEQLYLDSTKLPSHFNETLSGAVALPEMIIASGQQSLLLLTPDGQLIERLDHLDGVPRGITAIAVGESGKLLVRSSEGMSIGDMMEGSWQSALVTTASWSQPGAAPEALKQQLSQHNPGAKLPLERVILDLHSGRLFGTFGVYVMDVAAVLLLFSAASGVFIWWRRRRQQKQRRHAHNPINS